MREGRQKLLDKKISSYRRCESGLNLGWDLKDLEESLLIGSTLVEGSTLTENEARQVFAGKTVQGHPVSEIRELLNYRASVEWIIPQFSRSPYLSIDLILEFHARLFQSFPGSYGCWKAHQNYTYLSDGTRHDYVHPSKVEADIRKWVDRFNADASNDIAETVAKLYYTFQEIHPFEDGNGRVGRILIAYWLHWKKQSSLKFYLSDRISHLKALEAANRGDFLLLAKFFQERIGT